MCQYQILSDGRLRCRVCGDTTSRAWQGVDPERWPLRQCAPPAPSSRNHPDAPAPDVVLHAQVPAAFAFGSIIEWCLHRVGIRRHWVERVFLRVFGRPCECEQRKSRWNQFGWRLYYRLNQARRWLRWLSVRWWWHRGRGRHR